MVFESVWFGTISVAYMNLAHPKSVSVCGSYGLPHPVMISWLHSLNYIRNIYAHHSRLWNRGCRIKPMIARAFKSDLNTIMIVSMPSSSSCRSCWRRLRPEITGRKKLREL
jgi:abortive infection bacteriophage resistance protein